MFSANIGKLTERIRMFVVAGEVADLGVVLTTLAMDIITEYPMGMNLGCLDQEGFNKNPLGSQISVKLQELEKLSYLTAVIKESIRTTCGVVTLLARIAPDRVIQYGDWELPSRTPAGMSNGLTFDDESYIPDPHSFMPERWLDPEENERLEKGLRRSTGTRMCTGIK